MALVLDETKLQNLISFGAWTFDEKANTIIATKKKEAINLLSTLSLTVCIPVLWRHAPPPIYVSTEHEGGLSMTFADLEKNKTHAAEKKIREDKKKEGGGSGSR